MHDVHACMLTVVYKHKHVRTDQLEAFDTKIKHFGADCLLTFLNFCCYLLENMRARSKTTSERVLKDILSEICLNFHCAAVRSEKVS